MMVHQRLRRERERITALAARHGARELRVFGSVARGEERGDSDIDILVVMDTGRSLFDLGALQLELEEFLGQSVDVISEGGLREPTRGRILRDAIPL